MLKDASSSNLKFRKRFKTSSSKSTLIIAGLIGFSSLEVGALLRDGGDVGVRVGVIADLGAVGPDALDQVGMALGVLADHEERARHMVPFEHGQDLRGIFRIGAIVERQRHRTLIDDWAFGHELCSEIECPLQIAVCAHLGLKGPSTG